LADRCRRQVHASGARDVDACAEGSGISGKGACSLPTSGCQVIARAQRCIYFIRIARHCTARGSGILAAPKLTVAPSKGCRAWRHATVQQSISGLAPIMKIRGTSDARPWGVKPSRPIAPAPRGACPRRVCCNVPTLANAGGGQQGQEGQDPHGLPCSLHLSPCLMFASLCTPINCSTHDCYYLPACWLLAGAASACFQYYRVTAGKRVRSKGGQRKCGLCRS
jgi:hypothetical protein